MLSDTCVLTSLNIKCFTGRRIDAKATYDVANTNMVDASVGRYNKQLFPQCGVLKAIASAGGNIRTHFYKNTRPWGDNAVRILPSANVIPYADEFNKLQAVWQGYVDSFVNDYVTHITVAQQDLRGMFSYADYPSQTDIKDYFNVSLSFMPVPTNDFRVDLPQAVLDEMRDSLTDHLNNVHREAMAESWRQLHDTIKAVGDRLSDPDARFRAALIDNARETCALLKRLNYSDDAELNKMCGEAEVFLSEYAPETLRNDAIARETTAKRSADLVRRMAFNGGDVE